MLIWSERRRRVIARIQKERAADSLLRSVGAIRYSGGVWTQTQLNRKMREQNCYLPDLEVGNYCDADDMVLDSMYARLAEKAGLNPLYTEVFRMYMNGFSGEEISEILKIGRSRAFRIISICRIRLQKAYESDPYSGWYDVYLSEVNRHTE